MFALDTAEQTSKDIRAVSTSLDLSTSAERRRAATIASDSITYGVVPRLMILLAEQSCSSYRPGVLPVTHSPPSVPQKQRVTGKMQKLSRLAAMMNRMKTGKPWTLDANRHKASSTNAGGTTVTRFARLRQGSRYPIIIIIIIIIRIIRIRRRRRRRKKKKHAWCLPVSEQYRRRRVFM